MAVYIESTTSASMVKITDTSANMQVRYFPKTNTVITINGTNSLTFASGKETKSISVAEVVAPAGSWVDNAEGLADVLNQSPYFFKAAGGGGSVSPGNAYQLLRTNAAGNATEWATLRFMPLGLTTEVLRFFESNANLIKGLFKEANGVGIVNTDSNTLDSFIRLFNDGKIVLSSNMGNGTNKVTFDETDGVLFEDGKRMNGQPLRAYRSLHNNTSVTVQDIFTNNSGQTFYISTLKYYPTNIVNPVGNGTISIGTNATFDNEVTDFTPQVTYQDLNVSPGFNYGGVTPALGVVQPGQTLALNSKVVDGTGDNFEFEIVVTGYYL